MILPRRLFRSPTTAPWYSSGTDHFDVHHGLEQNGLRLATAFLEAHGCRDLERHLARIDLVIAAVGQRHLDVDDRIAGEDTRLRRFLHALFHGGDVLARDRRTLQLVLEDKARARLRGLDLEPHVTVLAATARLTHEPPLRLGLLTDGFAVGDLRLADIGVDLELAQQAVDDDLEVELAHAVDQRLVGLRIDIDLEGRVLEGEPGERQRPASPRRPWSWARWRPR